MTRRELGQAEIDEGERDSDYISDSETGILISSPTASDDMEVDALLSRPSLSCHQQFTDFSNVFKAFIGSYLIGIPFAIKNSGIALGLIGLLVIAFATDHCCCLIVKCKQIVIRKICERMAAEGYTLNHIRKHEKHLGRTLSYGTIGAMTMGKLGTLLVNTSILITQFGFCIGYFIFLGSTTRSVMYEFVHYHSINSSNLTNTTPVISNYTTVISNYTPLKDETVPGINFTALPNRILKYQDSLPPYTNVSSIQKRLEGESLLLAKSLQTNSTLESSNNNSLWQLYSKPILRKLKNPFSHSSLQENKAWTFAVLLLIPAPFLILISFVRNLRKLGPVSVLANGAITGAFFAVGVYILVDFQSPHEKIIWFNWLSFPVFFGQITGAYEGIGTVIPIEGSMAENRSRYPCYLHISLALLSTLYGSFGVLGYLRFGSETNQIVTENLEGSIIVVILRCLLFFGVLFTYPLQIYPVIEIAEGIIFRPRHQRRKVMSSRSTPVNSDVDDSGSGNLLQDDDGVELLSAKIPVWQSNILRCIVVLLTAAVAIAFRSQFAYIAALTGSIGSSLLSYILPCLFHIILKRKKVSRWIIAKDVAFVIFGIIGGIMGMTVTILEIIRTFGKHHVIRHS